MDENVRLFSQQDQTQMPFNTSRNIAGQNQTASIYDGQQDKCERRSISQSKSKPINSETGNLSSAETKIGSHGSLEEQTANEAQITQKSL